MMVNRAYRLSSTKEGFAKECNKLRTMFSKLRYPKTLVDSSITKFSQEPEKKNTRFFFKQKQVFLNWPYSDIADAGCSVVKT